MTRVVHNWFMSKIGTLNEKSLHASLKLWLSEPGDQFEVPLDGYVIDIMRGDELIEVQTGSFSPLKKKLRKLTESHRVHLVYPIAAEKWIVKNEKLKSRRKSPKRGNVFDLFAELVYIPDLLINENFSVEALLIQQEDLRVYDAKRAGRRRRGWVTKERYLLDVVERRPFYNSAELLALIPDTLPEQFTTSELAKAIGQPQRTAQKVAYCMRHLYEFQLVGKRGNAHLYSRG